MAADDLGEELFRLLVPVDHVLGIDRVRVDERVDVGDHRMATAYQGVCRLHTPWYARAARWPASYACVPQSAQFWKASPPMTVVSPDPSGFTVTSEVPFAQCVYMIFVPSGDHVGLLR